MLHFHISAESVMHHLVKCNQKFSKCNCACYRTTKPDCLQTKWFFVDLKTTFSGSFYSFQSFFFLNKSQMWSYFVLNKNNLHACLKPTNNNTPMHKNKKKKTIEALLTYRVSEFFFVYLFSCRIRSNEKYKNQPNLKLLYFTYVLLLLLYFFSGINLTYLWFVFNEWKKKKKKEKFICYL